MNQNQTRNPLINQMEGDGGLGKRKRSDKENKYGGNCDMNGYTI